MPSRLCGHVAMASIREVMPMMNDFFSIASFLMFIVDKIVNYGFPPRLLGVIILFSYNLPSNFQSSFKLSIN